jgi:ABC-type branched-subunit amino acid transport system substrate-binding protein
MKLGIEAAFNLANANGGVYGRQLRLIAVDDGYEPTRR